MVTKLRRRSKLHPSVTLARVLKEYNRYAARLTTGGVCIACGCDTEVCPPDAKDLECWVCGKLSVWGPKTLMAELVTNDNRS